METVDEYKNDFFIIKHKKEIDYTTIYNDCINDEQLSAESLAILVYVMSKPDNWSINVKNISRRYKIGRDKVRNAINILRTFGYMKRVRRRRKDGSLSNIVIYASDKPIFLHQVLPSAVISENNELNNKQPWPEIQAMVTEQKTDKQPQPDLPAPGFQAVDSLYVQKKDITKETTTNYDYGNDIDARARGRLSNNETNLYPDSATVTFFMKKIEGLSIPEATMISWLRKHGSDYIQEKIRVLNENLKAPNPSAFLAAAISYNWKEKKKSNAIMPEPRNEFPKKSEKTHSIEIEDAKNWFRYLTEKEKLIHYEKAIHAWKPLENALALKKASVLDEDFVDSVWFKPMMDSIGLKL